MNPVQSYQHTLREISVNRANPCELLRELISNAYDANASQVSVFPLVQKRGVLFFDNGIGLSAREEDRKNDVVPYVAFFSIGKGTKTVGQQIGYKCQGTKLCFASRRFSVITRCAGDAVWRYKIIDNPKQTLDLHYDLTPAETVAPWQILRSAILPDADERTTAILKRLDERFFREQFLHGTLVVVEEFETDSYDAYFSVEERIKNYLYNYIRFYTAHGDVRQISRDQGFSPIDVKAVRNLLRPERSCNLQYWIVRDRGDGGLESIPQGFPYLSQLDEKSESPAMVHQLRNGGFHARHATTFKYADRHYSIILAIDGNRRALNGYPELARRGHRRSGITLSDLRGPLLASNGIVVCTYRQLFDHPLLENDWRILQDGMEHYVLIIDGTFELVTNRDALAPSSLAILRDQEFVKQIRQFLQNVRHSKEGDILDQLIDRLNRETTRHEENAYIENNDRLRKEIPERDSFVIKNLPPLGERRIYAPQRGEEHFVGALYTMFTYLVPPKHPLTSYWTRPLTFSSLGIDAIAVVDERKALTNGNLISVEYKYAFNTADEFNHPLSVTERIICWHLSSPEIGDQVSDIYKYRGVVKRHIEYEGHTLGFVVGDISNDLELKELLHEIYVLSLPALLRVTFDVAFRSGGKPAKTQSSLKGVKSRRSSRS